MENLRRGAPLFAWLVLVLHFKFWGWNFFKGECKNWYFLRAIREFSLENWGVKMGLRLFKKRNLKAPNGDSTCGHSTTIFPFLLPSWPQPPRTTQFTAHHRQCFDDLLHGLSLSKLAAPLSLPCWFSLSLHGVHVWPPTNQPMVSSSGNTRGSRRLRRSQNARTRANRPWDDDDGWLGRAWPH